MANVTITQLPQAGAILGTEAVPIVQNGQTVQTTTAAIAGSPTQTYQYLTVIQTPNLPNSRYLSAGAGLLLTDAGAQSTYTISLDSTLASFNAALAGVMVKTSSSTVTNRFMQSSGAGITVTNGDGVSGNPTYSLTGNVLSLANCSGNGMLTFIDGIGVQPVTITGTASEIDVANGTGVAGNPTIGLSDNPIVPGVQGMVLPSGATGDRSGSPTNGTIRYNTSTSRFEGYQGGGWTSIGTGDGTVTSVNASGGTTGLSFTGGPITSSGTLTLTGTPTKATNVAGGAANKVVYQTALDTTGFVDAPVSADTFLKWNGSGFEWGAVAGAGTVTSVDGSGGTTGLTLSGGPITASGTLTIGGTLITSNGGTGLTSYTAGDLPYYASGTALSKLGIGLSTYLLTSSGTAPQWSDPTTVTVGTATTATNVAGGTANQIVYNTAAGTTSFVTAPTVANTYLEWSGSAFQWSANPLGTVTSVDASGGTTGLTFSGGPITTSGTLTVAGTLITSNGGTGLSSYTAGDLVYYASGTALSKLAVGTAGQVITSSGTAPQWSDQSSLSVGTATNVANGAANQIVYNTASSTTSFITAPTTADRFLKWTGAAFTWDVAGTGTVTSVDVSGGTTGLTFSGGPVTSSGTITMAGTLAVGNGGTGQTTAAAAFDALAPTTTQGDMIFRNATVNTRLAIGSSTYIMTSSGTAPQWSDPVGITVGTATNATNVATTATSVNATFYPTFVDASTGNNGIEVDTDLTYNPSTNTLTVPNLVATSGISGGTF